jgi:hypothetical protein
MDSRAEAGPWDCVTPDDRSLVPRIFTVPVDDLAELRVMLHEDRGLVVLREYSRPGPLREFGAGPMAVGGAGGLRAGAGGRDAGPRGRGRGGSGATTYRARRQVG